MHLQCAKVPGQLQNTALHRLSLIKGHHLVKDTLTNDIAKPMMIDQDEAAVSGQAVKGTVFDGQPVAFSGQRCANKPSTPCHLSTASLWLPQAKEEMVKSKLATLFWARSGSWQM
ncbi:hypothetical protein Z043_102068 [Scleropages formosus]|uniref:Uncharacterized protein n=1 Tax=Scleropages formosus TaxID=113540 RepID=A0A0P7V8E1_SCLFO|nr:hypothetical protein Z043_102068 [Scleropages formosus]